VAFLFLCDVWEDWDVYGHFDDYLSDKVIYFALQIGTPHSPCFPRRLWGFLQNIWTRQLHWKFMVCWNYICFFFQ